MIPPAVFLIVGFAVIFVMSVVLHEVGHGLVAYWCGDPTAYLAGRLTLNPIKHIDPIYTLLLPAVFIWLKLPILAGAKPVPVNPYHFKHPVRDDRLVSAAGIVINILIAWCLGMILHLLLWLKVVGWDSPVALVLGMGALGNLMLFTFNLMPIPPLDGSRILRSFLPSSARSAFDRMDRFGLMILYGVLFLTPIHVLIFWIIEVLWHYLLRYDPVLLGHVWYTFTSAIRGG